MVHQFKFGDVYRQRYLARNHKMGKRLSPTNPSKMLTQRDECPSIDSEPTALPAGPTACARARALRMRKKRRLSDAGPRPPAHVARVRRENNISEYTYIRTYIHIEKIHRYKYNPRARDPQVNAKTLLNSRASFGVPLDALAFRSRLDTAAHHLFT